MDPGTSTRENPIRAHLIKTLGIIGLRHIAKIDILGTNPTPIATPANEINGILLAKYLNPNRIIPNKLIIIKQKPWTNYSKIITIKLRKSTN